MSAEPCLEAIEYPGGVIAVDSGLLRPRMAACYLVECADQVLVIETGTNASVPRLLQVLHWRGWTPEQVSHVVVTHVHLDHAGGAGRLMQALPAAQLLVHPRGARHLADPARLEASVRQVYGDEEYERSYGTLVPVDAARMREMPDGATLSAGGREFRFRDTPGHARHHFCVWDAATRGWFTGDTFGLSYRELDTARGPFVFPTTTPIQFDPPALKASIDALLEAEPRWMYLTHFGRVGDVEHLAADMHRAIDVLVEIAERHRHAEARTTRIQDDMWSWWLTALREHGVELPNAQLREILWPDVELNTQGIEHWLDHGP